MDFANIISIYGRPLREECSLCHGEGCEACNEFGYVAYSASRETRYQFEYPMSINVKKRYQNTALKSILIISLTLLCILTLVVSYLINFASHG